MAGQELINKEPEHFFWNKGDWNSITPNFKTKEFECKCTNLSCITQKISVNLINKLNKIRETTKAPINVHSGYRCPEYQEQLKSLGFETAIGVSQHELGNAADVSSKNMHTLLDELKKEFKAIGVANTFIHVDTRYDKQRYWSYSK